MNQRLCRLAVALCALAGAFDGGSSYAMDQKELNQALKPLRDLFDHRGYSIVCHYKDISKSDGWSDIAATIISPWGILTDERKAENASVLFAYGDRTGYGVSSIDSLSVEGDEFEMVYSGKREDGVSVTTTLHFPNFLWLQSHPWDYSDDYQFGYGSVEDVRKNYDGPPYVQDLQCLVLDFDS